MNKCQNVEVRRYLQPACHKGPLFEKKKIKVFLPNFTFTAFYSSIFAKITVGKNCNRLDISQGPDISS